MTTFASTIRAGVLGVALAGAAAAWPAYACGEERNEGSKQSDIGAVTGLAVGAAAGGPVGAVLGAAAGALLGDRYHRQAEARAALAADLGKSEAERERLNRSVTQLDGTLARTEAQRTQIEAQRTQLDETVQHTDELTFEVGFRTNDDSIPAARVPPLLKLGGLLATMPQARARIAGYADPRGSDAYNDELSLRRAQAVAAVLMSAGVAGERILIEAHGKTESTSAAGDLDAYALERRVTVRVELEGSGQVARRD
jgi:outer membrane protein OmpA-like peptidoglycan-associated protein